MINSYIRPIFPPAQSRKTLAAIPRATFLRFQVSRQLGLIINKDLLVDYKFQIVLLSYE